MHIHQLKTLLASWKGKAGKKRDLLSLIGLLSHASKTVRPGREYVRRLINLPIHNSQAYGSLRTDQHGGPSQHGMVAVFSVHLEWYSLDVYQCPASTSHDTDL